MTRSSWTPLEAFKDASGSQKGSLVLNPRLFAVRVVSSAAVAVAAWGVSPVWAQAVPAQAAAQAVTPEGFIQSITNEVMATVKADKAIQSGDLRKITAVVDTKIMPNVNFVRMARPAQGPHHRGGRHRQLPPAGAVRAADATTNPSLILKAVQQPDYAPLLAETVAAHRPAPLDAIVDQVLVRFGLRDPEGGARPRQHRGRRAAVVRHRGHRGARAPPDRAVRSRRHRPRAVLIKIAATWEGIQAAAQLEREGIHCNLTLLFAFCQAVACGDAGVR
jgi:hypothetical protein